MKLAFANVEDATSEWRDSLYVAFDLGLPNMFNVEWLIDRAERGAWSGLWW